MLDERDKKILCAIVQSYIHRPDPVGSEYLNRRYSLSLSSATIRNIMAGLEEMGFLIQPHTSAGRIPTDKGYRLYVDGLCPSEYKFDDRAFIADIARELESMKTNLDLLLSETTKRLSNLSHYLSIALSPKAGTATFSRINLLRHRKNQIVTVLFTEEGMVKNNIVDIESELSQRDLNRISSYLNSEFSGLTINEIRTKMIREMTKDKLIFDTLVSNAINICREVLSFSSEDLFVYGFSEVLGLPDFAEVERIKEISKAIEDKNVIVQLLDKISESEGVQVIIGAENFLNEMKNFSIVASAYKEGNRPIGCVGIIGPTRMDYPRAIAVVDFAAKLITRVLEEK